MYERIFRAVAALLLSSCFFIDTSYAQSLPFKHYSIKDGLASSSVHSLFQDSKGFLWVGTEHGLSRFNGREFQNFSIEDGLENDYIDDIWEDDAGNTWIAVFKGGLSLFANGRFKSIKPKDGMLSDIVYAVAGDHEGNLWLGTYTGVCKFDGQNYTYYTEKDGLCNNIVYDIVCDKQGNPWFAAFNGLSYFRNGRFINYSIKDGLVDNNCRTLMLDRRGAVWIGTTGGLSRFFKGKFISYTTADGLPSNGINAISEDSKRNIWIGTDNGIAYFSGGKFTNYSSKSGLPGDRVFAIFEDREGNTWFGGGMGLSRLHSLRIVNFSVNDGLPNNLVWAILEEQEGKYWFGTDKGLSRYELGRFKNYTVNDGLLSNSIYTLMKDSTGKIWIGTDIGVSVFSGWKFKNYTTGDNVVFNTVLSFAEGKDGTIWIGTVNGLCRFHDGKITVSGFAQAQDPIQALLSDKNGNLWFSNTAGLCRVTGDSLTFYSVQDGLIGKDINSLLEDSRGRIWICTDQGLSCFNDGKFTDYTKAQGLADNVCYFVLEDNNRCIWIGTLRGISRFDGKSFKTYTSRDGLASDEMGHGACFKDSRGKLWFGTVNGVTRFDPGLDRVNSVLPPVYITGITLFGEERPLTPALQLKYNQNHIGFSFIGVSLTSPEDVTYKHRLQGIDRGWFEKKEAQVSYPYLPPGKYTFQVIAVNNDGFESSRPAELRFRILPPFWQTWWFRVFLLLTILFLIASLVLWRIKRVKEKMANEARNQQLVMAQKMELVGILAGGAVHDLKNLLSIILGYSKIAVQSINQNGETSKPLEKIKSTAMTAVSVVKQILAFSRQKYDQTMAVDLAVLLDDILEILKITTPPEIKIDWRRPAEEMRLYINPTKFQQVVMNLCLNAVQAIQGTGEVKISLSRDQAGQITLEVADNGIGMEEETANKIFDPLFTTKEPGKGTGLGLFVVKQIVAEQKGKIEVKSKPGEGSLFKITFPDRTGK